MTDQRCSAQDAIDRLRAGNRRFVSGQSTRGSRFEFIDTQRPFAVVLGCSDSRVPPEVVFDQGPGELFVVRVAGNVVTPAAVGSVEYAVAECGAQLVVVLGHTHCGAVRATIELLHTSDSGVSSNLEAVIGRIRPTVEGLLAERAPLADDASNELLSRSIRANVRASVNDLRLASDVLRRHMTDEEFLVVGAEYSIETGHVEFLEGPAQAASPT